MKAVLDQVLFSPRAAWCLAAGLALATDNQPVSAYTKPVFSRHAVSQFPQLGALELDQPFTDLAVEMVVLGIPVIMLKDSPASQGKAA